MQGEGLLDRAVAPLDGARREILSRLVKVPGASKIVLQRDRRIALFVSAHAVVACLLTATFPMLLFVLGPVLLGVAHVAADVRYLVLRRKLPAWWKNAVFVGCALLVGVRVLDEVGVGGTSLLRVELAMACAWILVALVAGAHVGGGTLRALVALGPLIAALFFSLMDPVTVRLVFLHAHNLVALALWIHLFRRRLSSMLVPLALILGAVIFLGSASTFSWAQATGGWMAFRVHLLVAAEWVAPGLSPEHAVGLTLVYTFLQSVHYSLLLLVIPQEDTSSEAPLTFKKSARSLVADFGRSGVAAVALTGLVVVVGAFSNVQRARSLYLSLAMFHGYLELAMLAYFWARGGLPFTVRKPIRAGQVAESSSSEARVIDAQARWSRAA
jgi:hypothetical protein